MNRFAELLDRLTYEPARNSKLRLMTEYFRSTGDPERGWALAALTGALSFQHAKPGLIRNLIAERTDPVLFALSYDYVGDLSETVALMWPASPALSSAARGGEELSLTDVVQTLSTLGKAQLPQQLARWLDALDETGRWALIKLVTGGLRVGVSARLAKAAVAALGGKEAQDIELLWPGLAPPYADLFAWLEGRGEKPASRDPAPFRPPMLAHALDEADLAALDPADFLAEWKWDGIRVQAVAARHDGANIARLYSRTGEDISGGFPDLIDAANTHGLLPLLYHHLCEVCPAETSTFPRQSLRSAFELNTRRNYFFAAELLRIMTDLKTGGVAAIPRNRSILSSARSKCAASMGFSK